MNNISITKIPTIILQTLEREERISKIESMTETYNGNYWEIEFITTTKNFKLEEKNDFHRNPMIIEWIVKSLRDNREYSLREKCHKWELIEVSNKYDTNGSRLFKYKIAFESKERI